MASIFDGWEKPDLFHLHEQVSDLLHDCQLLQTPRRQRGAWVKPGLADSSATLEKRLLESYHQLEKEVIASLSGRSDDVATGRLAQAKKVKVVSDAEVDAALDYYDLEEDERDRPVDRTRLAAILTLLALWLRRHRVIADGKAHELFAVGRKKALVEIGKTTLTEGPIAKELQDAIVGRFDADIQRLETGLGDGTARSEGLRSIIGQAKTVGEAVALLRRLFDGEQFRIGMLAEALVWWAWLDGYRSGAIEGTRAKLQANGVHLTDDLKPDDLSEEEVKGVPFYEWVGPEDEKACSPCLAQFHHTVLAIDENDLPSPSDICEFGIGCRHAWQLVQP